MQLANEKTCLSIRYVVSVHKMVTYPLTYTKKLYVSIYVCQYIYVTVHYLYNNHRVER